MEWAARLARVRVGRRPVLWGGRAAPAVRRAARALAARGVLHVVGPEVAAAPVVRPDPHPDPHRRLVLVVVSARGSGRRSSVSGRPLEGWRLASKGAQGCDRGSRVVLALREHRVPVHEPHERDPRADERGDEGARPLGEPRLAHHAAEAHALHTARGERVHPLTTPSPRHCRRASGRHAAESDVWGDNRGTAPLKSTRQPAVALRPAHPPPRDATRAASASGPTWFGFGLGLGLGIGLGLGLGLEASGPPRCPRASCGRACRGRRTHLARDRVRDRGWVRVRVRVRVMVRVGVG